jgi:hypothetical protein
MIENIISQYQIKEFIKFGSKGISTINNEIYLGYFRVNALNYNFYVKKIDNKLIITDNGEFARIYGVSSKRYHIEIEIYIKENFNEIIIQDEVILISKKTFDDFKQKIINKSVKIINKSAKS